MSDPGPRAKAKRAREQRASRSRQADELAVCRQVGGSRLLVDAVLADTRHPLALYFAHVRAERRKATKSHADGVEDEPSPEGFARWHAMHCESRSPVVWAPAPPELQRLGPKSVQLLYVDPPWPYPGNAGGGLKGMVGKQYYKTPEMDSLFSFIDEWLEPYLADDCALLVWATGPRAHAALALLSAWRFDYKNEFLVWLKTFRNGEPVLGLGHFTRTCTEKLLLGARGNVRHLLDEVRVFFFKLPPAFLKDFLHRRCAGKRHR